MLWRLIQIFELFLPFRPLEMWGDKLSLEVNSQYRTQSAANKVIVHKSCGEVFLPYCTANVCRDLQGLCGEIVVQGFKIYRDCMYTHNPCNFWSQLKKSVDFLHIHLIKIFQISL